MPFDTNEITNEVNSNDDSEEKQHFLTDEKYQLLQHYQRFISKATDVSPTIRKLVNDLITIENLEKVKTKLIDIFSN